MMFLNKVTLSNTCMFTEKLNKIFEICENSIGTETMDHLFKKKIIKIYSIIQINLLFYEPLLIFSTSK